MLKANPKGKLLADAFTKGNVVHTTSLEGENGSESGKKDAEGNMQMSITAFDLAAQAEDMKVGIHTIQRARKADVHLPRIESAAVKAVLECRVLGEGDRQGGGLIRVGDHVLVVARITGIAEVADFKASLLEARQGRLAHGNALCYVDGAYAAAGSSWGTPGWWSGKQGK